MDRKVPVRFGSDSLTKSHIVFCGDSSIAAETDPYNKTALKMIVEHFQDEEAKRPAPADASSATLKHSQPFGVILVLNVGEAKAVLFEQSKTTAAAAAGGGDDGENLPHQLHQVVNMAKSGMCNVALLLFPDSENADAGNNQTVADAFAKLATEHVQPNLHSKSKFAVIRGKNKSAKEAEFFDEVKPQINDFLVAGGVLGK